MGDCMSCFKNETSIDNTISHNGDKDEMAEVIVTVSPYPQEEPLLQNNENHVNNLKSTSQNANSMNTFVEQCIEEANAPKSILITEKVHKPIYKKLPSLPITMTSLGSSEPRVSESKLIILYDQYKDSLEDAILAEGIENLCNDLQLNPDDFKVLVLAWKLNASQMCRFTKTEFVQGLKNMKTDSIKGIQQKLNEITADFNRETDHFKELYRFTFKFGLDVTTGQRILPTDIAILLWRLVFTSTEPPILDRWLMYLEKNPHIRGIPKDTWNMFLNFCEFVGDDLSSYDDTEAWPSLFDDFVEYENDQMNQNITKNDIKIQD